MQDWAPLVSAAAASLAALLAGINLYVSGRREHLSWTRSALEQALVDFLTAHYDHLDACKKYADEPTADRNEAIATARAADAVMMSCITRFRVLASSDLAGAALAVRAHNDADLSRLESGPGAALMVRDEVTERGRKAARDAFVAQAQELLAVRG